MLCEAAQTAKRHPQFAAGYQAIAQRRGKKIATTAVARKLLTCAWHLLTDAGTPQPRNPPRPRQQHRDGPGAGRMAPGELEDLPEPGHGPRSPN